MPSSSGNRHPSPPRDDGEDTRDREQAAQYHAKRESFLLPEKQPREENDQEHR